MPLLPWDFVVLGTPASLQSSSRFKTRWKDAVRTAALAAWPPGELPLTDKLRIQVTCFHDGAHPLDADNMLKPIQDALNGLVYNDDSQLTDTHGAMRDLNGAYLVRGISLALAVGFRADVPFVHVKIDVPPEQGRLP